MPPDRSCSIPRGTRSALSGSGSACRVDAISLWLMILTTFLIAPGDRSSASAAFAIAKLEYYAWMNALLLVMVGVFVSADLLLFYVFFELTLVPMFFIIGIWGGSQRRYAAGKFFLFTFGRLGLHPGRDRFMSGMRAGTFDIRAGRHVRTDEPSDAYRTMVGGAGAPHRICGEDAALSGAHVAAAGAYRSSDGRLGHPRRCSAQTRHLWTAPPGGADRHPQMPVGRRCSRSLVHFVGVICIIGVIYAALVAWVQPDIKKLVAYSSVSHLGFCVLGLFALNDIGMQGSVLYMINHGLSTGAMFLVIGMIYDRYHTRDINELSGLAKQDADSERSSSSSSCWQASGCRG